MDVSIQEDIYGMHWYALYTKCRHEKFLHAELGKRGFESFLPLRTIQRQWSDRIAVLHEPLFKGYLFVRTNQNRSKDVFRAKGAVRFVRNSNGPVLVQPGIIESLKKAMEEKIPLETFGHLNQGDRVFVRSGIFKGAEGIVLHKNQKKCRIVIQIDAVMSSISVEVDSCLVEKL